MIKLFYNKPKIDKESILSELHYLRLAVECEHSSFLQHYNLCRDMPSCLEYINDEHQKFLLTIDKQLDNIEEQL